MGYGNEKVIIQSTKYQIISCSVMGDGKIENQDSFGIYHDESQIIVIVADGLGSAKFSKEGSSKIVGIATGVLKSNIAYEEMPIEILKQWKDGLDGNLNSYDTTMKFIHIKNNEIIYGGVGDGWIAINKENRFVSLCANNTFSNQTDSLLSFDLKNKFVIKKEIINGFKNLLISTDGFSEDMDKEHGLEFLNDVYAQINVGSKEFGADIENTLNNWPVESNKDDKTVVFIQRMED